MNRILALGLAMVVMTFSGCAITRPPVHNSSSLVDFLYPDGQIPPPNNSIPELHVPLRVGLAFLPSHNGDSDVTLDAAHREVLMQRIRQRFTSRKFVSDIVVIPDYYLSSGRGFDTLAGVQRLYNVDVMALVSYDQVTHADANRLSLGYVTIVGAFVLPGTMHDTATLVDLAVVDPATRSLVLRAGGVNVQNGTSTAVGLERDARLEGIKGFDAATDQMVGNFDTALTQFESDVHAGRANVRVVARNDDDDRGGGHFGGGGALGYLELLALVGAVALRLVVRRV